MLEGLELDFGIVIKIEFGAGSVVVIDNVDVGIEVEGKKKNYHLGLEGIVYNKKLG